MKRCSISKSHQRRCKIKSGYLNLLFENTDTNSGKDVEQQELSFPAGRNAKWCKHFERQFNISLTNFNMFLSYNPVISLVVIHPKRSKFRSIKTLHIDIYTAWFTIVKACKQRRYYSVGEWINMLW